MDRFTFEVLEEDQKEKLHTWLYRNRNLYPWVYFPNEIEFSNKFDHWYPVVYDNGSIIAWMKVGRSQVYVHDFETVTEFPDKLAFIYDTFVDPEYRGRGLGSMMIKQTKIFLAEHGYDAVACHIEDWNKPSIKTFQSNSFSPLGQIRFLRILFFRLLLVEGRPRRLNTLSHWLEKKKDSVRNQKKDGLISHR